MIYIRMETKVIDPVGYFEFLALLKNTKLVLTDSGGIQEEACIMGVPCVTVRTNTERPETIEVGANILGGFNKTSIIKAANRLLNKENFNWENPFGDGKSADRIVETTLNYIDKSKQF